MKLSWVALAIAVAAGQAGCTRADRVDRGENEHAAQTDQAKREAYRRQMDRKIDELDRRIDAWSAKADAASARADEKARAKAEQVKADLKRARSELSDAMKRLDASSEATWDDAKAQVEGAYDAIVARLRGDSDQPTEDAGAPPRSTTAHERGETPRRRK